MKERLGEHLSDRGKAEGGDRRGGFTIGGGKLIISAREDRNR